MFATRLQVSIANTGREPFDMLMAYMVLIDEVCVILSCNTQWVDTHLQQVITNLSEETRSEFYINDMNAYTI